MHPTTYRALVKRWAKVNGVELPGMADDKAEIVAHQHNLVGVLRTRFGSRPAE